MPRLRLTIGGSQLGWVKVRDGWRGRIHAWQDRIRDPTLTVLLILYLAAIFVALPLAAEGLAIARPVAEGLDPYVDGPLLARCFCSDLIRSLASICPACWCART